MTKQLRRIVVDGMLYRWVLPGNSLLLDTIHLSVFTRKAGQPLRIDPYAWDFTIRPRSVASAIRFARSQGWAPDNPGSDWFVAQRGEDFLVLPPGVRYLHELEQPGPRQVR